MNYVVDKLNNGADITLHKGIKFICLYFVK